MNGLRRAAGSALLLADPQQKCAAVAALARRELPDAVDTGCSGPVPVRAVGRPARPRRVDPRRLPKRSLSSVDGRRSLIHAVVHIEFNAINLALDAAHRFDAMPDEYYRDWLDVAADEARHFTLLCERLGELGCGYGDFDAHDGLWDMACRTAHDPLLRMALVPRVLEARGLDVTPAMIDKLDRAGDAATADILRLILEEEITHVAIGSRWFKYLCRRRGVAAEATFRRLTSAHYRGGLRGPFNHAARLRAGFSRTELSRLGST